MHIFISYSSKEEKQAFQVCELLEKSGKKCYIAPRDIQPGKEYGEEIVKGIDGSKAVVLLLSENANHSPHVLREVERAVSKSIPILICKLEEVELTKSMEYFLMMHQWVNVRTQDDYSKLIGWVENLTGETADSKAVNNEKADRKKPEEETQESVCATGERAVTASARKDTKKSFYGKKWLLVALLILFLLVAGVAGIGVARLKAKPVAQLKVGDTITLGTYNEEPVSWRVLKLNEDHTAVLVAKDILAMKAYDAAEGGKYNRYENEEYWSRDTAADTDLQLQIKVRGNSDWRVSNIRTWLNSQAEVVQYEDQEPRSTAMAEEKNGYHNEPGFLHAFTEKELEAIVETEKMTKTNGLYDAEVVTTMDRVYLLSLEELKWFEEAGISLLAVPTDAAVEQDQSHWYIIDRDTYNIKEYCWWLREPVADTGSKCYVVWNGYYEENVRQENVGLEGYGIRPAITVDLRAEALLEASRATD